MTRATGIGSFPGTNAREAIVTVRDLLLDADGIGLPYLPETPARGPGADIIGRGAGLLVDLPVDLQPSGWRFTDRPGRDTRRTASLWTEDLDELAAAYDGYHGPLKTQVAGPWTLASGIDLQRGERAVTDEGAAREIIESLAEGVRRHVADLRRLVPGAELTVQLDEPSLTAVLEGTLPTASGFGKVRAVDRQVVAAGLRTVLAAHDGPTVIHCCHPRAPVPLLRSLAPSALALDLTEASAARWESVALTLEEGIDLYAGCLPAGGTALAAADVRRHARGIREGLERAGLGPEWLSRVTITPACGLPGLTSQQARDVHRAAMDVARELTEATQEQE